MKRKNRFATFNKTQLFRFHTNYIKCEKTECWEWISHTFPNGYGRFNARYKSFLAHRASWIISGKKIPTGKILCHRCDNRKCVNPNHLFPGSQSDNIKDMVHKGRQAHGEKNGNAKLTMAQVRIIRLLHRYGNFTIKEIADFFKRPVSTIRNVTSGLRWTNARKQT